MVGISARRERRHVGSERGGRACVRHPRGGAAFLGGCWNPNVVKKCTCVEVIWFGVTEAKKYERPGGAAWCGVSEPACVEAVCGATEEQGR